MTRINVISVSELTPKHLVAEYREIVRVFALVRKRQAKGMSVSIPPEYTLGEGHVTFFYNKLGFILKRYHDLTNDMRRRNYTPNPVSDTDLTIDIDSKWFGDYKPTEAAMQINRQRIFDRLAEK